MENPNAILVAIDFSLSSEHALRQALRLAAADNAKAHALHVVDVPAQTPVPPALLPIRLPTVADLIADARQRWPGFAPDLPAKAGTRFDAIAGNPRREIIERVRATHPALLVMGADGGSGAATGVGTLAAACVRRAEAPVLLVREGQTGPYRRITACIDFSPGSRAALDQAVRFATRDKAEVHVLHVYDDPWGRLAAPAVGQENMPAFKASLGQSVETRLRQFCEPNASSLASLCASFNAVEHDRKHGNLGRTIIRFLADRRSDLCILATRSTVSIREFVLGTTADRVLRDAPCGILAVKPPADSARA